MSIERRRHQRVNEQHSVVVKVSRSPNDPSLHSKSFYGSTDNLSESGLGLRLPVAIPEGSTVDVSVAFLDMTAAFRHVGRVVWQGEAPKGSCFRAGLEIVDTPSAVDDEWKKTLSRRL